MQIETISHKWASQNIKVCIFGIPQVGIWVFRFWSTPGKKMVTNIFCKRIFNIRKIKMCKHIRPPIFRHLDHLSHCTLGEHKSSRPRSWRLEHMARNTWIFKHNLHTQTKHSECFSHSDIWMPRNAEILELSRNRLSAWGGPRVIPTSWWSHPGQVDL